MTRILLLALLQLCCTTLFAQEEQQTFRAYLYNNEYDVYLRINFYDEDIEVPGQSLYGKLPGFLGKVHNSFCWVITSCKMFLMEFCLVQAMHIKHFVKSL